MGKIFAFYWLNLENPWATFIYHSVEPQTHSEWRRQLTSLWWRNGSNTIIEGHVDGGCLWSSCKIHFSLGRLKAVSVATLWKIFNSPEVLFKGLPVSYHWNTECEYNQVSHRIISEEFDLTNAVTLLGPCVHFSVLLKSTRSYWHPVCKTLDGSDGWNENKLARAEIQDEYCPSFNIIIAWRTWISFVYKCNAKSCKLQETT